MIIYNVTIQVENDIAGEWLSWMKEEHIPRVMGTNCFTKYQIVKLVEVDETESKTYAVQYSANSKADYNRYIELHAPALRKETIDKWGDRFVAFRSLMEVVQ